MVEKLIEQSYDAVFIQKHLVTEIVDKETDEVVIAEVV